MLTNKERKKDMIHTIKNGSIVTWQHINLQGEYDFSDKHLKDAIDFKKSELLDLRVG